MSYENTPLEPTPRASAYDHLPPYTSFAPSWTATRLTRPVAPVFVNGTPPGRRRLTMVAVFAAVTIVIVLAYVRTYPPNPRPLDSLPRATAAAFLVAIPVGWTTDALPDSGTVLKISTTLESFTVRSLAVDARSCVTELVELAAKIPGTRSLAAPPALDGSLASGFTVSDPPTEHTLVCAERNGGTYMIDDKRTGPDSSFAEIMASWRWR